ncbi:MAG TPA: hypothetical protein VKT81_20875 [Bryobacteraceae bacterium]|nr:hypothetical protein [Bryobacteraceae bacterium]
MKNRLLSLTLGAALLALAPVTGMAAEHRGEGFSHGTPNRGEVRRDFDRRGSSREFGDRDFHRDYRARGYDRGFGFGVGVYPGYAPVCSPAGFYDRFGVWHFYPGCAY